MVDIPDAPILYSWETLPWTDMLQWFTYAIGLFIYVWLIWHFYRFVARRDIFGKHLSIHHPGITGFLEDFLLGMFRVGKYGILFPIVSFLWFGGFVALLFVVAQNQTIEQIALIAIGLVGAARMLAYYKEDMSQELAKTIPIVILGVALTEPDFFQLSAIVSRVELLPALGATLFPFILYLSGLELFLRVALWIKQVGIGENAEK